MKKALAVLLTLALIFTFAACAPEAPVETPPAGETPPAAPPAEEQNTAPIRIGFFAPESAASAAADGQSARQSAELAVKLINEEGGVNGRTVELVAYDDGLDTTEAANIAEKLITADKVDAVVSGSYSGPTRVAAPIFQEAGLPMVAAYAVHPDVVNAGDFIFSQSFPGAVQGTAGAKFAVDSLGAKNIAIIAVDLDFGKELANYFRTYAEANGATIVSEDYVAISDNDFTSVISKLKGMDIDLIYSANYYAHASEIVRQCALQGLECAILGTEGADSWQLLETAGEYAENLYITTNMNRDDVLASTQKYIENYKAEYKMQPDMVGASVYDAFQVLFAAFAEKGTDDKAAVRDYIQNMKDFETVTGELLYYTAAGSAVKAVQIQQVQGGGFHEFAVIDDPAIIDPANY